MVKYSLCNNTNKSLCFCDKIYNFLLDKINFSDVVSVKIKMASNLLVSTQFCEIIFEIIFRDPLQCFVIEEKWSGFILWLAKPGPEFRCRIDNNGKILVELLSRLAPRPGRLNWFPVTMNQMRIRGPGQSLLLLLLSALSSGSEAREQRQYFIREPDNQTAIEGEQVITVTGSQSWRCSSLIHYHQLCSWYRYFRVKYSALNPTARTRYWTAASLLFLYHKANLPLNCPVYPSNEWLVLVSLQ